MKQPTIEYEGVEHKVRGVNWHEDGKLFSANFYDQHDRFQVAFQLSGWEEEGLDSTGNLNLDLNKRLKAGE